MTTQVAIQVDSRSLGPLPVGDPESSQLTQDISHHQQDHIVRPPPLPSSSQTPSPSSSSSSSALSSSTSSTAPSPSSTCALTACSSSSSLASSTTSPAVAKSLSKPAPANTSVPASSQSWSQASSTTPSEPNSSQQQESTRATKKQEAKQSQEHTPGNHLTQQHSTATTLQRDQAPASSDNCSTSQLLATPTASSTGKRRKMGKGLEFMNDSGIPMDVEELSSSHTTGDSSTDRLGVSNSASSATSSSLTRSAIATNQPTTNTSRPSSNNEAIAVTAATLSGGLFDDSGNSGGSTTDLHCNLSGANTETSATRASQDKSSAAQPVHKSNNIRAFGELFDDDDLE